MSASLNAEPPRVEPSQPEPSRASTLSPIAELEQRGAVWLKDYGGIVKLLAFSNVTFPLLLSLEEAQLVLQRKQTKECFPSVRPSVPPSAPTPSLEPGRPAAGLPSPRSIPPSLPAVAASSLPKSCEPSGELAAKRILRRTNPYGALH